MIGICKRRCWDGHKTRRYYPGDQDDIDPKGEMAEHFIFPDAKEAPRVESPKIEAAADVQDEKPKKLSSGALKAMEVAKKRREKEKEKK